MQVFDHSLSKIRARTSGRRAPQKGNPLNIQETVFDYIRSKNTDYAILINGQWGVGKTYYIRNTLKPQLAGEFSSHKILYLSMNGLSSIEGFKRVILYSYISKKDEIDESVVNTVLDTGSSIDSFYIKDILNLAKMAKSIFEMKKLKTLNAINTILIIDDLERVSKKISLEDVLGTIYDIFISNGGKVIFVAFEEELKKRKKKYEQIREKYIRYAFDFLPDMKEQISNYLALNNEDSAYTKYVQTNLESIATIMDKSNHRNLRTFSFYYEICRRPYLLLNGITEKPKIIDSIFKTILVLVIEYKKGMENSIENELPNMRSLIYSEVKESEYLGGFKSHYIGILGIPFCYLDSLIRYVLHGIFDSEVIEKEIRGHFYIDFVIPKIETEEQKALRMIADFRIIEKDALEKYLMEAIAFTKAGSYQLGTYIEIYSNAKYLVENGYTAIVSVSDIESAVRLGFSNAIARDDEELTESGIFMIEDSYSRLKSDPIISEILERMREKYNRAKIGKEGEKVRKLLEAANSNDDEFRTILFSLNSIKIFENIVNSGALQLFEQLNNHGIYWIESLVREIIRTSNAKQTYLSQVPYLETILEKVDELSSISKEDQMRKKRLLDCIAIINAAIEHINNSQQ